MKPLTFSQKHRTISNLLNNSRFYILFFSILLSIIIASALRSSIENDQLFYIRVEQVYGFIALIFWYFALIVTPLQKVIGNKPWIDLLQFSRRAFGVSAAYYAILHVLITVLGQLGGISQLSLLPDRFKVSLILGAAALVILIVMAATSFDKVIQLLTFPRWKAIHRFGYFAATLALIHVWLVGTHIGQFNISLTAFIMLALLLGLESLRIGHNLSVKLSSLTGRKNLLSIAVWCIFMGMLYGIPQYIANYHDQKHGNHIEGDHHENH